MIQKNSQTREMQFIINKFYTKDKIKSFKEEHKLLERHLVDILYDFETKKETDIIMIRLDNRKANGKECYLFLKLENKYLFIKTCKDVFEASDIYKKIILELTKYFGYSKYRQYSYIYNHCKYDEMEKMYKRFQREEELRSTKFLK